MKHVLTTLAFYASTPGWYSFDKRNRATVRAIESLRKRGFLEVNPGTFQARFTGKVFT